MARWARLSSVIAWHLVVGRWMRCIQCWSKEELERDQAHGRKGGRCKIGNTGETTMRKTARTAHIAFLPAPSSAWCPRARLARMESGANTRRLIGGPTVALVEPRSLRRSPRRGKIPPSRSSRVMSRRRRNTRLSSVEVVRSPYNALI
jgi:hypothetical protein